MNLIRWLRCHVFFSHRIGKAEDPYAIDRCADCCQEVWRWE